MRRYIPQSFLVFISVAALISACSSASDKNLPESVKDLDNLTVYPPDAQSSHTIKFTEEQTFGDTEEIVVGSYTDIAVGAEGKVFIADAQQQNIKVFSPDGRFLKLLGQEGAGPAEFKNVQDLQASQDFLFGHDTNQNKTVIFSLDSLTHSHSIILAANKNDIDELKGAYRGNYLLRSDNQMVMTFTQSSLSDKTENWEPVKRLKRYFLLDEKGNITSPQQILSDSSYSQLLIPFGQRRISMPVDFMPKSLLQLTANDKLITARTDLFLVKYYSSAGEYERAVYYPAKPAELTKESVEQAGLGELIVENMNEISGQEYWPVIAKVIPDSQNRLWVATITNDMSVYAWKVLNEQGVLLAEFIWPRTKQIEVVDGDKLYAITEDVDTGIKSVKRFSFIFE